MSVRNIVMAAAGAAGGITLVEDVFSTSLYTGNSSTQTITNGIDLAGQGGLVWLKGRSAFSNNILTDTVRGANGRLFSNTTSAEASNSGLFSFTSSGFSLGNGDFNQSPETYVSWTFRQGRKFFDVVTYTGNGGAQTINHTLGTTIGAVIIKRTDTTSSWPTWVRNSSGNFAVFDVSGRGLNSDTSALNPDLNSYNAAFTASTLDVGSTGIGAFGNTNVSGGTYVAYIFAHDTTTEGIVQCGSFTTDGSGNGSFNHGWSEGTQFVMLKSSDATQGWEMFDKTRTPSWSGADARLLANSSDAEDTVSRLSESGTTLSFAGLFASTMYSFLIIRAPA